MNTHFDHLNKKTYFYEYTKKALDSYWVATCIVKNWGGVFFRAIPKDGSFEISLISSVNTSKPLKEYEELPILGPKLTSEHFSEEQITQMKNEILSHIVKEEEKMLARKIK